MSETTETRMTQSRENLSVMAGNAAWNDIMDIQGKLMAKSLDISSQKPAKVQSVHDLLRLLNQQNLLLQAADAARMACCGEE